MHAISNLCLILDILFCDSWILSEVHCIEQEIRGSMAHQVQQKGATSSFCAGRSKFGLVTKLSRTRCDGELPFPPDQLNGVLYSAMWGYYGATPYTRKPRDMVAVLGGSCASKLR